MKLCYYETRSCIYTYKIFRWRVANVARILHKCKGAVYRITYSKKKGGASGLFPSSYQAQLLSYAKLHNIDLGPEDFFYPERLQALIQESSSSPSTFCDDFSGCRDVCKWNDMQQLHYEERK
ncbi:hypothetical protein O99_00447 [Bartonella rochalimae ATCC BAA-1498]|uniref:Uncharacterized protein n=1 Tax=Bartonella rochalimae ATCC BAA-1498 TaxID=685782 RepID=A0A067WAI4_9HYPH|nr:hypothetical protein O99_00447 [Bartonella rochalimae ATCC BAA-1498]